MRRAIFMDRDGTVIEETGYVRHPDAVRLIEGSARAVRKANQTGFQTVIVTNQSGVARGMFTEETVAEIHDRLRELLSEHDARIDGIYYCPHHPEVGGERYRKRCNCRKPAAGMLHRARDEMGIDLASAYMIGDSLRDIEAGRAAGAKTILVLTGFGRRQLELSSGDRALQPDRVSENLLDAVEWILSRESERQLPERSDRSASGP